MPENQKNREELWEYTGGDIIISKDSPREVQVAQLVASFENNMPFIGVDVDEDVMAEARRIFATKEKS